MDRDWPQAEQFVDAVEAAMRALPSIKPYYAGTESRLKELTGERIMISVCFLS